MNKRKSLAVAWVSVVFAAYCVFVSYQSMSKIKLAMLFCLALLVCGGVTYVGIALFPTFTKLIRDNRIEQFFAVKISSRAFFWGIWVVISLLWIPAYLSLFPGVFGYDAPIQYMQFTGVQDLTAHHPVLHTMLMGSMISFGHHITGSYNAGVAMYTLLQGLIVTNCLAHSFSFMKRKKVPVIIILLGAGWAALNPNLQALSFNCTKDILFGASFVYFVISFWRWCDHCKEEVSASKGDWTRLIISGVLMCLLRNQGKYIVIFLLLACLILRKKRLQHLICIGSIVLISQLFFSVCTNGLGIEGGDAREMLSVPIQQIAKVTNQELYGEGADISAQQLDSVYELIPQEVFAGYEKDTADPIKSEFNTTALKDNVGKYIKTYIQIGIQNPKLYVNAFRDMVLPYWNTEENQYRGLCFLYTFPTYNQWGIQRHSLLPTYYGELVNSVVNMDYRQFPVISVLMKPSFCVWLLTALFGITAAYKKRDAFLCVLPIVLYFGTLLLGPVSLTRYLYPILLAVPLLVGALWMNDDSPEESINGIKEEKENEDSK